MAAYGALAVILALYLSRLGFSEKKIGLILTLTLIGDTIISLALTVIADRIGRRRVLIAGSILMALAGLIFVLSTNWIVLLIAATIGVISPSGKEVGPFLSIEQAALSQIIPARNRTAVFAWYTLSGAMATAACSLVAGFLVEALQGRYLTPLESQRVVIVLYAA